MSISNTASIVSTAYSEGYEAGFNDAKAKVAQLALEWAGETNVGDIIATMRAFAEAVSEQIILDPKDGSAK